MVASKPLAWWLTALSVGDVPHAPVLAVGEALEQEYVKYRHMVIEATHPSYGPVKMVGPVIKERGEVPAPAMAPPMLGEHNVEVLRSCGYSDADIDKLRKGGVIA
jgi:crotonobetainyl-CoA:carnitine CoA-transferase CaiB-like acyl-CoA transferase